MGRRRWGGEAGAALLFVVLAGAAWFLREHWLAALRTPAAGTEAAAVPGAAVDASAKDDAPTELVASAGSDSLEPEPGDPDGSHAEQALTAAALALPTGPARAIQPDASHRSGPKLSPASLAAGSTEPQPSPDGADIAVDQTQTGLRRYTAPPSPAAAPLHSNIDPVEDGLLLAWELSPADGPTLTPLVSHLLEQGRTDDALEQVVRFAEEGGSLSEVRTWVEQLDSLATRTEHLLSDAVERLLSLASAAQARDLWASSAALLDRADELLLALRLELGRQPAELLDRSAEQRERLVSSSEALTLLARLGAPLPDGIVIGSRLAAKRASLADARAVEQDRAVEVTSRNGRVTSLLPRETVQRASLVLEAVSEEARRRFPGAKPPPGPLEVELVTSQSTFESRRLALATPPPAWMRAFLDPTRTRLVVLDPREAGADVSALDGLVARETARRTLAGLRPGDQPLPPWLEWGLVTGLEGCLVSARGEVDLSRPPHDRRRELVAAVLHKVHPTRSVDDVLQGDGRDPGLVAWSWALLAWLEAGAPGLPQAPADPPLPTLLAAYANDAPLSPAVVLRSTALRSSDSSAPTPHEVQRAFEGWLLAATQRWSGEPAALQAALVEVERQIQLRRLTEAESTLRELLAAAVPEPRTLAAAVALHRRKGRSDLALLAALALAEALPPSPAGASETADPYAEARDVQHDVGEGFAQHHLTLAQEGEVLVHDLLADGRPLAALRMLDRLLAAAPLDQGWQLLRRRLLDQVLGGQAPLIRRRVILDKQLTGLHGEPEPWRPRGSTLDALTADRAEPATLRGLVQLSPPWRVQVRLAWEDDGAYRPSPDRRTAGLLFGAEDAMDHGQWGVLASPNGRVELASRGRLEWPGQPIGRGGRESVLLEVRLEDGRLSVLADGKPLDVPELGSRPAAGWLGLYARQSQVAFEQLTLVRDRQRDPAGVWHTRAGF